MARNKLVATSLDKKIAELASKCDKKILVIWAVDCAERVLPFFEKEYPKDDRPRNAINAGQAWLLGKIKFTDVRKAALAAHAAARDANQIPEAYFAARAAGHAAATVHVARHAQHAATYAATAVAQANFDNASAAANTERKWQYQHLLNLSKN